MKQQERESINKPFFYEDTGKPVIRFACFFFFQTQNDK